MRGVPLTDCTPCLDRRHEACEGWHEGFCGCTSGLCGLRLLTGVMWHLQDPPPNGHVKGEP